MGERQGWGGKGERETDRERQRQRETQRERDRDRQTDRQRFNFHGTNHLVNFRETYFCLDKNLQVTINRFSLFLQRCCMSPLSAAWPGFYEIRIHRNSLSLLSFVLSGCFTLSLHLFPFPLRWPADRASAARRENGYCQRVSLSAAPRALMVRRVLGGELG